MVEVNWTSQAIQDIDNIARFIAQDSVKYAKIQTKRFFDEAHILEKSPKAGRIVPEFNNPLIREIIFGNYRIVYKMVSAKRIDILAVHHSARLLKTVRLK